MYNNLVSKKLQDPSFSVQRYSSSIRTNKTIF